MSTAGMDALVAASLFSDITLTFALTPSDFVWQGFEQGEKDGCKEWPIPGASTLSWKGEPLAYMPFIYEHPVYWQKIQEETKGSGDIERSTCLFIDSENAREHTEEEMIPVENIKGNPVYIEGRLRTRKYTDKQGVERFSTEIVAESLQFLGARNAATPPSHTASQPHAAPAAQSAQLAASAQSLSEDDVPF